MTDRLAAILDEERLAAGATIFSEGEPPDDFYFVRQGPLQLISDHRVLETVEGPRAFGFLDAFLERPRTTSAVALAPITLVRVRVDAWLELLEDSFELARMSVRGLARSVAALETSVDTPALETAPVERPVVDIAAPLDMVDRLAVLMSTRPLRGVGAQPLSDLASMCEEITVGAGVKLFERHDMDARAFVIVNGRVEGLRERPGAAWNGGPGQVVCGFAPFAGALSEWEAHAVVRTRALSFRVEDWIDILEENFEMVRATLTALAREHERLRGVAVSDVRGGPRQGTRR